MSARQLPLAIKLREDATFANYIGEAPRLLRDAGVALVFGEPGTGKSHLLQAACHEARGAGRVAFFLDAPAEHDPGIVEGLESLDVVCIDDVDTVMGQRDWEIALFHLVNAAKDGGRTLILSSTRAVSALEVGLADLKSRLLAASAIETNRLDDAQKRQLLKEKATRQGFELGDEVAKFILSRADRSPRGLIDLLSAIEVATLAHQKKVTIHLVKSVLGQ